MADPEGWEEHKHEELAHSHEHFHVTHNHNAHTGGFEHLSAAHEHEHNHAALAHSHYPHQDFQREHESEAHVHDHTRSPAARGEVLTEAELGTPLGGRATLVQFSSAFCAPCRATRVILSDVAGQVDGVRHVEIDAESHLDLVGRLDIRRTPTVLVLGPDGHVTRRASGLPRKTDVLAALGEVG
jgi:thiol-disulfide isomerase/thioredoxin